MGEKLGGVLTEVGLLVPLLPLLPLLTTVGPRVGVGVGDGVGVLGR